MKYLIVFIGLCFYGLRLSAQTSYSLQQATEYALTHAPDVQKTELGRKVSEAKLQQALSKYLPRFSASGDVRNNFQRQTIVLPISLDPSRPGQPTALKQGTAWTATFAVEATQNIYDPSFTGDKKINKASIEYSQAQWNEAKVNKKVAVAKAYYAALLSQQKMMVALADTQQKSISYQNALIKWQSGKALKTEKDKALVLRNNSKILYQKAKQQYTIDQVYLAWQMGLNNVNALTLTDELKVPNEELKEQTLSNVQNASIATEESNKRVLQLNENKIKLQYLPTVQLYGYLGTQALRTDPSFLNINETWYGIGYAGLKVSIPVFDGFEKRHQTAQQKLIIKQSDSQLQSLLNQSSYEMTEAKSRMEIALENLSLQKENLEVANSLLAVANSRKAEGRALEQEVIEANYTVNDTRLLYSQAIYDYLVAKLDFQKATGQIVP